MATASLINAWLVIEQSGAWGPDTLVDSGFPIEEARPLLREAARLDIRVLLIRQRKTETPERTVFLADSGGDGQAPSLRVGSWADPSHLPDIDLEALAAGRVVDFGHQIDGPLYLVCTHGRHDICCADKGRPLFRAMSELRPDRTWEVSHIGGDRFAGNLVVLPRGDYFGRLAPEDASSLVAGYEAGSLDLDHHRGRSIYPRLAQAAERFLRETRSLSGFDDLELVDYRRLDHDHAEVVFRDPDRVAHRVRVVASAVSAPDYLTCRAEEPGQPVAYVLQSITTI